MAIQLPHIRSFVRLFSTEEMKEFWTFLINDTKAARPHCRFLCIPYSWEIAQFSIEQAHEFCTSATRLMSVHRNIMSCKHYAEHCPLSELTYI
jgi:hypothetical protein